MKTKEERDQTKPNFLVIRGSRRRRFHTEKLHLRELENHPLSSSLIEFSLIVRQPRSKTSPHVLLLSPSIDNIVSPSNVRPLTIPFFVSYTYIYPSLIFRHTLYRLFKKFPLFPIFIDSNKFYFGRI